MTTFVDTEANKTEGAPTPSFVIADYLEARARMTDFTMVEIGHDMLPVAYQQEPPFTDDRFYVGLEAWTHDPQGKKRDLLARRHEQFTGLKDNITFEDVSLGGMVRYSGDDGNSERWFEGTYEFKAPLASNSAHEVFLGNVFGDPDLSESTESTTNVLAEALRIVTDDGVIVVRESLTPEHTRALNTALATYDNLSVTRIGSREIIIGALESTYAVDRTHDSEDKYYLFIQKLDKESIH